MNLIIQIATMGFVVALGGTLSIGAIIIGGILFLIGLPFYLWEKKQEAPE